MNSWQSVIGVLWCMENMLEQAVRREETDSIQQLCVRIPTLKEPTTIDE